MNAPAPSPFVLLRLRWLQLRRALPLYGIVLLGVLRLEREVLMLGEPINGLDLASVRVLEAIIRRIAGRGRTVLITSHMLGPLIALCDGIHLLQHGRFTRAFERGKMDGLEEALFAELDARTRAVVDEWGSGRG